MTSAQMLEASAQKMTEQSFEKIYGTLGGVVSTLPAMTKMRNN